MSQRAAQASQVGPANGPPVTIPDSEDSAHG
jgi:hypothetical protein